MKKKIAKIILMMTSIVLISCTNTMAEEEDYHEMSNAVIGYCWEVGTDYDISIPLLMSIVYEESRGKADAKNGNCVGLTQINKAYFKDYMEKLEITDLYNPYQNVRLCGYQLLQWFEKYGDEDVYLIVNMWNMGEQNALAIYNPNNPSSYAKRIVDRADRWTPIWDAEQERKRP